MFTQRSFVACACGLMCILAGENRLLAVDPAFAAEVKGILVDGWPCDVAAFNKATNHMASAHNLVPGDFRPSFAWTLVQMKANNYKQAVGIVDGVVADSPNELAPRQAQIWLRAAEKEYPEMLSAIMALAVHLPKADADAAPNDAEKEAAKFLGRIFGFFTGPGAGRLPDAKWDQREKLITDDLHSILREAFGQGRDEVSKKFAATQDSVRGEVKSGDNPAVQAAKTPASGGAASPADSPAAAALKTKYLADRAETEKKIASLQTDYNKLAGQGQSASAKIQQAEQSAQQKNSEAQKETNAAKKNNLKKDAQTALNNVAKDQQEFVKLKAEATAKQNEAKQLQQKLVLLTNQFKADAAKLGPAGSSIASVAAPVDTTPIGDPMKGKPGANSAEDPKALDGYLPFALVAHKQSIIDSLGK